VLLFALQRLQLEQWGLSPSLDGRVRMSPQEMPNRESDIKDLLCWPVTIGSKELTLHNERKPHTASPFTGKGTMTVLAHPRRLGRNTPQQEISLKGSLSRFIGLRRRSRASGKFLIMRGMLREMIPTLRTIFLLSSASRITHTQQELCDGRLVLAIAKLAIRRLGYCVPLSSLTLNPSPSLRARILFVPGFNVFVVSVMIFFTTMCRCS